MKDAGVVILAVVCIVCVTILGVFGKDSSALIQFVTLIPTIGIFAKLTRVEKQTNGQLDAARTGAKQAGYVAGYIDAAKGRQPEHEEAPSGVRVADAFPTDADIEAAKTAARRRPYRSPQRPGAAGSIDPPH